MNPRPRRLSTPPDAFDLHPDIASYGTALKLSADRDANGRPLRRFLTFENRATDALSDGRGVAHVRHRLTTDFVRDNRLRSFLSAPFFSFGEVEVVAESTVPQDLLWRRVHIYTGPHTTALAW